MQNPGQINDPYGARLFHSQRPGEQVLLETRRHWWSWVRWLPVPVLFLLAGIAGAALLPGLGGLFVLVGLVFGLAFMLFMYADWINDSIIVTDQRIVRITRNLLRFSQQVSEIPLSSIQEINADIPNWDPFALAFHYGFVALKTSGNAGDVTLTMIPNPDGMQDLVLADYSRRQQQIGQQQSLEMRRQLERWVYGGGAQPDFAGTAAAPRATNEPVRNAPWSPFIQSYLTETGAIVFRHHWIVWVRKVFVPLFVLLGAFVSVFVLQALGLGFVGCSISFVLGLIGGLWFWYQDTDFRNDYMIVNDTTVTIYHQRPLWLQNERDVLLLKRVDNIIAESQGLINQLMNKGTLRFALIGSNTYKEFRDIGDPLRIQAELARRQGMAKRQDAEEAAQQQQQLIGQYISMYHEMIGAPPPQGAAVPPGYAPQQSYPPAAAAVPPPGSAAPLRDANRPPIVPQQRPALSQGRPYTPAPYNAPQPFGPPGMQTPLSGQGYAQPQGTPPPGAAPDPRQYPPPGYAPPPPPPTDNRPPRFRRSDK